MNKLPSTFSNLEYWLAYGAIDWKSWKDNDIKKAAENIVHRLPGNTEETVKILDLGLGIGILELPLLAQIQQQRNCPIYLVGIDLSWEALEVTRRFLTENGIGEDLPTSTEDFLYYVEKYWPNKRHYNEWMKDSKTGLCYSFGKGRGVSPKEVTFLLIETNLDYLDLISERGAVVSSIVDMQSSVSGWRSLPSNWSADLTKLLTEATLQADKTAFPEKFDVLITSLSLMHLKWWRRTLWHGLRFLRQGGMFLHSKLGGDELIFEGGGAPKDKATCTAERVFGEFFDDEKIKSFMRNAARHYTVTSPRELYDFMNHIFNVNETDVGIASYKVTNTVNKKHYRALLDTAGYSILHSIKKRMKQVYDDISDKVRRDFLQENETVSKYDNRPLISDITWDIYKLTNPQFILQWQELFSERANHVTIEVDANLTPIQRNLEFYQLQTAIRCGLSWDIFTTGDPGPDTRGYAIARILETGGLLNQEALGGDISLKTESGSFKFKAFINPHRLVSITDDDPCVKARNFIESMRQYISMILEKKYSNTKALVEIFLPMLGKPCVLTFRKSKRLSIDIIPSSGFYEIRVSLSVDNQNSEKNISITPKEYFGQVEEADATSDAGLRHSFFLISSFDNFPFPMTNFLFF